MSKKRPRKYRTTREQFKTVKRYDHAQFDQFCELIYTQGYEEGKKSVTTKEIDLNSLMETIGGVKGIGAARLNKIKELVSERYGLEATGSNG